MELNENTAKYKIVKINHGKLKDLYLILVKKRFLFWTYWSENSYSKDFNPIHSTIEEAEYEISKNQNKLNTPVSKPSTFIKYV